MLASSIPTKIVLPFANNAGGAYINVVPVASQIGITNGAASFYDGFPPNTFIALAAGGAGPFGKDFNGLLNVMSAWERWYCAGGPVTYDSAFQMTSQVGGYPNGAVVASATTAGLYWRSTADNNTTNPDSGGAGWVSFFPMSALAVFLSPGTSNWTVPSGVYQIYAEVWGGGGGGTGTDGGAGGGGGYAAGYFAVTPGQAISITVGAGGIGGTRGITPGGAGGTSSCGALCSATGGAGTGAGPGAGGSGSGGQINLVGGAGTDLDGTNTIAPGGAGAGGGGAPSSINQGGELAGATAPGGGGSAAAGDASGSVGAAGMVIIEY